MAHRTFSKNSEVEKCLNSVFSRFLHHINCTSTQNRVISFRFCKVSARSSYLKCSQSELAVFLLQLAYPVCQQMQYTVHLWTIVRLIYHIYLNINSVVGFFLFFGCAPFGYLYSFYVIASISSILPVYCRIQTHNPRVFCPKH
jgi:hypothetical protein